MISECSVEGCVRPKYVRGYCGPHYKRWWKYGNPTAGDTYKGEVRKWIETVAIPYQGDDCLPFPYCTSKDGRSRVNIDGTSVGAYVFVLEQASGRKPTPEHEACHSCGNGDEACVNPNHLYWGTREQNVADARRHGVLRGRMSRPKEIAA